VEHHGRHACNAYGFSGKIRFSFFPEPDACFESFSVKYLDEHYVCTFWEQRMRAKGSSRFLNIHRVYAIGEYRAMRGAQRHCRNFIALAVYHERGINAVRRGLVFYRDEIRGQDGLTQ